MKFKRVNSKKQALEDFAEHCETLKESGYHGRQIQAMMNHWAEEMIEMRNSDDPTKQEAAVIFAFAILGAKAAILREMGAKVSIAQAEGVERESES